MRFYFTDYYELEDAMANTMFLGEFIDNTSKIVNGRDFLKLDARKIKNFKEM